MYNIGYSVFQLPQEYACGFFVSSQESTEYPELQYTIRRKERQNPKLKEKETWRKEVKSRDMVSSWDPSEG